MGSKGSKGVKCPKGCIPVGIQQGCGRPMQMMRQMVIFFQQT